MKEGTTLGARAQSAILRAAVLYKPRLATFNLFTAGADRTLNIALFNTTTQKGSQEMKKKIR
jgi:hypothetical protein